MELFVLWLVMAGVVAIVANSKGRDAFPWFLYGFLIWPIALTHAIVLTGRQPAAASADSRAKPRRRPCPHCAEPILPAAKICRFCGSEVEPIAAAKAPAFSQALATLEEAGGPGRVLADNLNRGLLLTDTDDPQRRHALKVQRIEMCDELYLIGRLDEVDDQAVPLSRIDSIVDRQSGRTYDVPKEFVTRMCRR